jgi:predicted nucleotidyltransferase component of viral defense system
MIPSEESIVRIQRSDPFSFEALETVLRLRDLLHSVSSDSFLGPRLALKGGTALNLCFRSLPRLSVDIDFNDIGNPDRAGAVAERPAVIEAVERIGRRAGYRIQRSREEHAGQKLYFQYDSVRGGRRRIEVDVNFLHRVALAPTRQRVVWGPRGELPVKCLVMSPAELLAGKILALLDRSAARDLFDIVRLPRALHKVFGDATARKVFIALSGTLPHPLTRYGRERLDRLTQTSVEQTLYPLLRTRDRPTADELREQAWEVIESWVTLAKPEADFVQRIQQGELRPELIFEGNRRMIARLRSHPALQWKIRNAQLHNSGRG